MIVALAVTILLALSLARRAMEPHCPACASKSWAAHSTQLNCTRCGWTNGARPAAPEPRPEPSQYEMCLG